MLTHKILTSGYYYSRVARKPGGAFKLIQAISFYRMSVIVGLKAQNKYANWKYIFLTYQRVIQDNRIKRFLSMAQL